MPKHRYSGDPRYYPHLGLHVKHGAEHDLETPPDDGRWLPAEPKKTRTGKPESTKE